MNILTPAALDNAELAYVHAVAEAVRAGETDSEKITKVGLQAAFNAAIARLIEEGRAKKGKFLNDASEPAFWDDGIFIKGEP